LSGSRFSPAFEKSEAADLNFHSALFLLRDISSLLGNECSELDSRQFERRADFNAIRELEPSVVLADLRCFFCDRFLGWRRGFSSGFLAGAVASGCLGAVEAPIGAFQQSLYGITSPRRGYSK
jgi:hypothetical protein